MGEVYVYVYDVSATWVILLLLFLDTFKCVFSDFQALRA
jgi:hypothetical protein